MKNILCSCLLALCCPALYGQANENVLPAYSLEFSQVRQIHSESNNKEYELYIRLPNSYATTKTNYPLIVINDVKYAFPIASGMMHLMGGVDIKEAILVGISYSKGDSGDLSRRRDYTPTAMADRPGSGNAKEYVQFIGQQIIPEIKKYYRVDDKNKVFVGHSYGGLLGAYILTHQPELFDHYVLGSPSLWYDNEVMFKMEADYAKQHKDMKANVAFFVGSNENNYRPMVDDLLEFETQLRARQYPNLKMTVEVLQGETHYSVFPALLSKGLVKVIPKTQH